MFEEEKTIPAETEVPEGSDDAFLDGLFADEAIFGEETDESAAPEGDAAHEEEAAPDGAAAETEGGAANEGEGEAEATGDTDPAAEELFELKYNGQTLSVPRSEMIALAQKGKNYDHVKGQLDGLKNSNAQRQLAELAAEMNMTPEAYMDFVYQNRHARRAQELADAEGITPELANRIIANEDELSRYKATEKTNSENEARDKMIRDFVRAYPDVKGTDIPDEVWQAVHAGADLVDAYRAYENKQLKDELAAAKAALETKKQNESNEQKAVGSVRGSKSAATEDAFLAGLSEG